MPKFRKKPVIIEAFQMTEARRWDSSIWPGWLHEAWTRHPGEKAMWPDPDQGINGPKLVCGTLEGVHKISWGDWIIQGVQGEIYPCKPDIFQETYEFVSD